MSCQLCTYELISFLLIFVQYLPVIRSETEKNSWTNAVSYCNNRNATMESNETVLKNYIETHQGITNLWVGKFKAFLPWIEIRGCYRMPQICNSKDRDEKVAPNSSLCQLRCINRQYFAFNPNNYRCVCFDEHGIVTNESKNASLCQTCEDRTDCNAYAVAYKVLNRSISDASGEHACLSYSCTTSKVMPIFTEFGCIKHLKPYCRNGRRASDTRDLQFFEYINSCERNHFSYPLLQSKNPAQLCNIPEAKGTNIWVGVYRQELVAEVSEITELQNFYQRVKNITECYYLSRNGSVQKTKICKDLNTLHHYICTADTFQKDPNNSPTLAPACGSADLKIPITDNKSSGLISGIVTSIVVILVIVVVIVFCRKRCISKTPQLKNNHNDRIPPKTNACAHAMISDGYETDVTLGPYSFAKPLSDTNIRHASKEKEAENENEYSRIVSAVFNASNKTEETNNCIANPGYNDVQMNNYKTNPIGYKDSSNSLPSATISGDYCLAKPIPNPGEIDTYTDNADYDHLGNVTNRDDYTVKVYDHVPNIIDSDATYDHSTITICKSESDNYDHFDVQN